MEIIKPVFWYQGLFLQPQHFQLMEQYRDALLNRLVLRHHPHFWGVYCFEPKMAELQNESLELERGDFIFQDGTWTSYPGNATVLPRSFAKTRYREGRPLKVYAGLAKWRSAGANVSGNEDPTRTASPNARFICDHEPEEIRDLYQAGLAAQIRRMSYAVQFFWEDEIEQTSDYYLLPVAQLEYDGRDVRLGASFIPPSVTLQSSPALLQILKNIREQIAARCRQLEKFKRPIRLRKTEADQNYMIYVLILQSLSRQVPWLYHLTETQDTHPWAAYGLLRQLVGELSTFTDAIDILGRTPEERELLPPYDHKNLSYCFREAQALVEDLLHSILIVPETVLQLDRRDISFSADISPEYLMPNYEYYLAVTTRAETQEPVKLDHFIRGIKDAKFGSRKRIEDQIRNYLPGVPKDYRSTPPLGLPRRADTYYFRLESEDPEWKDYIVRDRSISMYWVDAPDDAQAEVYIFRGV
jgi:type VI secretion system protein ImpJ